MKKIILSFFIIIFFACSSKQKQDPYVIQSDCKIIDIEEYNDVFNLEDLVESTTFCKLETNDSCFIGKINKIIVDSNLLFVFDCYRAKTLYLFSRTGEFLNKFGEEGRGPEEHIEIYDFDIDQDKKEVLILDLNGRKIQYYNYNGTYLRTRKLDFLATEIKTDKDLLCYKVESSRNKDIENKKYVTVNTKDGSIYPYFDSRDINPKFSYTISSTMNKYNGHIYISPRYVNTIYKMEDYHLKQELHLKLKDSISSDVLKDISDKKFEKIRQQKSFLNDWVILSDYVYLKIMTPKGLYRVFSSDSSRNIISGYGHTYTNTQSTCPYLFFFYEPISGYKNELIEAVSAGSILERKKYRCSEQARPLLDSLYKDLSEDSNPVIFFHKLKKF